MRHTYQFRWHKVENLNLVLVVLIGNRYFLISNQIEKLERGTKQLYYGVGFYVINSDKTK